MSVPLPDLIVHADWSVNEAKRWLASATLQANGLYLVGPPQLAPAPADLVANLKSKLSPRAAILAGFDFPIGIPDAYANHIGAEDFLVFLEGLGTEHWREFWQVAASETEITSYRPFYPARPGGSRQCHLTKALGVASIDDLRRCCEKAPYRTGRPAAPLFWTLGAQQVGKAALHGWQNLLQPALAGDAGVSIWPFHGELSDLLRPGRLVMAEVYPAEFYTQLGLDFRQVRIGDRGGKRSQSNRTAFGPHLHWWAQDSDVLLHPDLVKVMEDGFGSGSTGEDKFDAFVGVLGLVHALRRPLSDLEPQCERIRRVEGWILGQYWQPAGSGPVPMDAAGGCTG